MEHKPSLEGDRFRRDAEAAAKWAADYLERVGELPSREELLACMLDGIAPRVADWQAGRWDGLLAGWRRLDALAGRRVRVHSGAEEFAAEALGVAADGLLEVRAGDGTLRRLVAAEVHLQ